MFLKQLKKTSPITVILYMFFAVLFCILPIFNNSYELIYSHHFFSKHTIFILAILIPVLQSVGLNNLIYEKDIIKKNSLVVAPISLLFYTPFISNVDDWIVSFALLFYLNTIFACFQKEKPFSLSFNANFLISSISIFYTEVLLLYPLIFIVFLIYNNLTWRSFLISIIGISTPIAIYWTYSFIFNLPFNYYLPEYSLPDLTFPLFKEYSYIKLIWFILVFIIVTCSFLELFFWMYKKSIRSRKSFFIILAYLFILLFVNFQNSCFIILTPITIIVANFFVYSKRTKLTELLFFVLVITSIYYRLSI